MYKCFFLCFYFSILIAWWRRRWWWWDFITMMHMVNGHGVTAGQYLHEIRRRFCVWRIWCTGILRSCNSITYQLWGLTHVTSLQHTWARVAVVFSRLFESRIVSVYSVDIPSEIIAWKGGCLVVSASRLFFKRYYC